MLEFVLLDSGQSMAVGRDELRSLPVSFKVLLNEVSLELLRCFVASRCELGYAQRYF